MCVYAHIYIYIYIYETPCLAVPFCAVLWQPLGEAPRGAARLMPEKADPYIYIYIYTHMYTYTCLSLYISLSLYLSLSLYIYIYLCGQVAA